MIRLSVVAVLFVVSSFQFAHAFTITLEPATWYLMSVPGANESSVADIVGDQMHADELGQTWAVHAYDSQSRSYRQSSPDMVLNEGDAFWLLHFQDSAVEIQVALDAPTVELVHQTGCASPFGCFEYPLPAGDGVAWSMLGSPFPEGVAVGEIVLVTTGGPCTSGCTLDVALEKGMSNNSLFGFDEKTNSYTTVSDGDYIEAGEGYWLATKVPSEFAPARLIMPTFCTPIDT